LAKEYQRNDGFSDLPPKPGQIVVCLNDDSSDLDDDCNSISEEDSTADEMNVSVDSSCEIHECNFTPKRLF